MTVVKRWTGSLWEIVGSANSGIPRSIYEVTIAAAAGTDITSQIQSAMNTAAANLQDLDLSIIPTTPGALLISGSLVTATAQGYTYNGQINVPAVTTATPLVFRIRGVQPPMYARDPNDSTPRGGTILLSNATSGWVIDGIPGYIEAGNNTPWTDIQLVLQDITVRGPNNPQCGGVNCSVIRRFGTRGTVCFDVNNASGAPTFPTGPNAALITPPDHSGASSHCEGTVMVWGWPIGVIPGAHTRFELLSTNYCNVGMQPVALDGVHTDHCISWGRWLAQECVTLINVPNSGNNGGALYGLIDFEMNTGGSFALQNIVNDSAHRLLGKITVWGGSNGTGLPMIGGYGLNVGNLQFGDVGWMNTAPWDTFTRVVKPASAQQIGWADQSMHPWVNAMSGAWTIDANGLQLNTTGTVQNIACRWSNIWTKGSRTVEASISTNSDGSYNVGILPNYVNSNTFLQVFLNAATVNLSKSVGGTITALTTGGTVASSTTYTLTAILTKPPSGAAWTVQVLLNGTSVITYTCTSQDMIDLAESLTGSIADGIHQPGTWVTQDGVYAKTDTGSRIKSFRVFPSVA